MTFPIFKTSDSLKCKEMVRRAEIIAASQGKRPRLLQWAGDDDREWEADGIYIFYIPGRVMKIFATRPDVSHREPIYQHSPPDLPYATDRWQLIERAVEVMKRHMVLDDLADA